MTTTASSQRDTRSLSDTSVGGAHASHDVGPPMVRPPRPSSLPSRDAGYRVSVVIAAFADERWPDTLAAVKSVQTQTDQPMETILVDHNPSLIKRARREITGIQIVENTGPRGASGARNSGVLVARGDIIAFLDDDAIATPTWLRNLCQHFVDPSVTGVGGGITPAWPAARPRWFPREFDWVVGASYLGMPEVASPVRNVWTGNMAIRRSAFEAVDGFRAGFGKTGNVSRPEDTDLCLRVARAQPEKHWFYEPAAEIAHKVPPYRSTRKFFLKRCWHEGRGKAALSSLVGIADGTAAERRYAMRVLPRGFIRELSGAVLRRELAPFEKCVAIMIGLAASTAGLATEMLIGWKGRGFQPPLIYSTTSAHTTRRANRTVSGSDGGWVVNADGNQLALVRIPTYAFRPVQLAEWEVTGPAPRFGAQAAEVPAASGHIRVLARMNTEPLGCVDIECEPGQAFSEIAPRLIWEQFRDSIKARLPAAVLQEPIELSAEGLNVDASESDYLASRARLLADAPQISVVVSTRDRSGHLKACIQRLASQRYPNFEIVVVDNAPSSVDAVPDALAHIDTLVPIRYVLETRGGLAWARNAGWRAATGDFIAFLDDDEIVDDYWLAELLRGFTAAEKVGCVSGIILPAALETQAQEWFEQFGGHSKGRGFAPTVFELGDAQSPLYPLPPFGAGGNMAFRRQTLLDIGGFNVALGAGTPAKGGEDTFAFTRALLARHRMVYQPSALVWHNHYDDVAGLARQLHGYGRGLTAFYTALLCHNPRLLFPLLRLVPLALHDLRGKDSIRIKAMRDFPAELICKQRRGMAVGAFCYMKSVYAQRSKGSVSGRDRLSRDYEWTFRQPSAANEGSE